MQDLRQTRQWAKFLESQGWIVEEIGRSRVYVFIKKIPLTPFSLMKLQRWQGRLNLEELRSLRKKYRVVYSVLEPLERSQTYRLRGEGYKLAGSPYLPSKTVVIDLKKSRKKLWAELSQNARRILSKEEGVEVARVDDLARFCRGWRRAKGGMVWKKQRLEKLLGAFDSKAKLLVSRKDGEWLSGLVILQSKDTANYFQTWTNSRGRQLGSHYFLVWQAMLEAKKEGLKYFDFEGVFDRRFPMKNWRGFSEFKKKFGGSEISFPGCFARWL